MLTVLFDLSISIEWVILDEFDVNIDMACLGSFKHFSQGFLAKKYHLGRTWDWNLKPKQFLVTKSEARRFQAKRLDKKSVRSLAYKIIID